MKAGDNGREQGRESGGGGSGMNPVLGQCRCLYVD